VETKTDTLIIKERITDTIIREKTIEITKPIRNNVFLPCPDDKKKPTSGGTNSGDSSANWKYDHEKGGYDVELYCAESISIKDSIIQKIQKDFDTYKANVKTSEKYDKKVIYKDSYWKIAFFVLLSLFVIFLIRTFVLNKLFS